jgi:hypothetical protein
MQTPPAIGKTLLCLFPIFTKYSKANLLEKSKTKDGEAGQDSSSEDNLNLDYPSNAGSDDSIKGFITIKNKKQEITKLELTNLIEYTKKSINTKSIVYDNNYKHNFRELANGVFQAEGHIGGYFPSSRTVTFRPIVYISQNASDTSIEFLVLLWRFSGKKLEFIISQNEGSKHFHIRLFSRNWEFIIHKIIPYFSLVYGDKYKGFIKLKDIYNLHKGSNILPETKVKVINLAYSLVNSLACGVKTLSKNEKLSVVLGETIPSVYSSNTCPDNDQPLSLLFILGFLLGDGNFDIRIRDTKTGVWFIPRVRLEQKQTLDNSNLFNIMVEYLNKLNIEGSISKYQKTPLSSHIVLTIEKKASIGNFLKSIEKHRELFFWKNSQINKVIKSFIILSVAARHWKQSQIALVKFLYNDNDNNHEFSLDHWLKRLDSLYGSMNRSGFISNEFYITLSKDKAWAVTLPVALKIKPKTKYFFFKTFSGSKEEALNAAVNYRNTQLNNWLLYNGFRI